ncbi:MAG: glycosyltransferase family 39 protein [Bauldia sp.]|nr:glycosyltransferase family 39 protein [Bauldia sp.]
MRPKAIEGLFVRAAGESDAARASLLGDPTALGIAAFFFGHALIRVLGSSNLGLDDDEAVVQAQVWQLLYSDYNPPLFTWLTFALQSLLGPSLALVEFLEAALLTAGGIFLYRAALPAFRHGVALQAGIAGYGLTAIYGWGIFEEYSHSIALIFAIGFTVWALMRAIRRGTHLDYAILGVAIGVGVLSKYLYLLFAAALAGSALLRREYRERLVLPRLALTAVVALAAISPLLFGLLALDGQTARTAAGLAERIGSSVSLPRAFRNLLRSALPFVLPLALYLGLVFLLDRRRSARPAPEPDPPRPGDPAFVPLLRDATIAMVAAMVLAVLVLRTNFYNARYLIAPLTLSPLLAFAWIDRWGAFPAAAVGRFLRTALVTIGVVAGVRILLYLLLAPPLCPTRCATFVDYAAIAERIAPAPGQIGVIRTVHSRIAANLLIRVPDSFVLVPGHTAGVEAAIANGLPRRCTLVWFQSFGPDPPMNEAEALAAALGRAPTAEESGALAEVETVTGAWQANLLPARDPPPVFGLAELDPSSPICGAHGSGA